jgi:hypothetical protein
LRARLRRNFGTAANQVLWRGQAPLVGDPAFAAEAVFAIDEWLARVHADRRKIPLSRKIIQDKPGTLADRCTDGTGNELPSPVCDQTVSSYGTPRQGADGPLSEDVMKCRLEPLRRDDYPVDFTAAQWSRLQEAFPDGVCDYSRRGKGQRGTIPWLTYQTRRGRAVYGGKSMGEPPRSRRVRTG